PLDGERPRLGVAASRSLRRQQELSVAAWWSAALPVFLTSAHAAVTLQRAMKTDIHPDYHFVTVRLADGTTFQTRSTMEGDTFNSEVDATNHPFYTGKRQFIDTAGRVEKFRRRYGKAQGEEPA